MFYFDTEYLIFVLPAIIIAMIAQSRVNTTFNKYSKIINSRGITGAEVAQKILNLYGNTTSPKTRTRIHCYRIPIKNKATFFQKQNRKWNKW